MRFPVSDSSATAYRSQIENLVVLGGVLERVERNPVAVDADQYQLLVARLQAALSVPLPEKALTAILAAMPSVAEVYENMHYPLSGLSSATLEQSVSSELATAKLLGQVSQRSEEG